MLSKVKLSLMGFAITPGGVRPKHRVPSAPPLPALRRGAAAEWRKALLEACQRLRLQAVCASYDAPRVGDKVGTLCGQSRVAAHTFEQRAPKLPLQVARWR